MSFLAYCLQVTLKARLKQSATGLTPRAVLEKCATVQMLDVHLIRSPPARACPTGQPVGCLSRSARLPTTYGREIIMARYTQPEKDLQLLLDQLKLSLPEQPPPKITSFTMLPSP